MDDADVQEWYDGMQQRHETRMKPVRDFLVREDSAKYTKVLETVLSLFGEGIHKSLSRTMGDHFDATGGEKANSKLKEWEWEQDCKLLCHNNHAERGFAVVKELIGKFPSMKRMNVRHIAHARLSGLFKPIPDNDMQCEWQILDGALQKSLTKLCCVRVHSLGLVTRMMRTNEIADDVDLLKHLEDRKKEELQKKADTLAKKARKLDALNEVDMVESTTKFRAHIKALNGRKGEIQKFLKQQAQKRIENKRSYPDIPEHYKTKHKKIRLTAPKGTDQTAYLQTLVQLMIDADNDNWEAAGDVNMDATIRALPVICPEHTDLACTRFKTEHAEKLLETARPTGDTELAHLEKVYKGQILFDADDCGTYQILSVAYVQHGSGKYWVAVCVGAAPAGGGSHAILPENLLPDSGEASPDALVDYVLADITDPCLFKKMPEVDEMILAHKNRAINTSS